MLFDEAPVKLYINIAPYSKGWPSIDGWFAGCDFYTLQGGLKGRYFSIRDSESLKNLGYGSVEVNGMEVPL